MFIAALIVSVLLGLAFLGAGVAKLRPAEPVTGTLETLGVTPGLQRVIGALEVLGGIGLAVGLWLEPLGLLAAIGLVAMMAGAILYHVKAKDSIKNSVGAIVLLVAPGVAVALQAATL